MGKNNAARNKKYPFVSICTPTFNRRPFYKHIIKCIENQTYPKDRIEWIIIDDGTDKIEDLVTQLMYVRYFKYDYKMSLGQKRNIAHEKSLGKIIVYMDDDDYYPPERISHAVETLKNNPQALCAGSSEMYIFFKHIQQMYQFGPYGPNHATAATFAFKRELLTQTSYKNDAAVAEERHFLKEYTIPFVQLDPLKTILVFSHIHNSFDKKTLLDNPNKFMKVSDKTIDDFMKDPEMKKFYAQDIDNLLEKYNPGKVENKPDVVKQLAEIKKDMEEKQKQHQLQMQQMYQMQQMQQILQSNQSNAVVHEQKINEQNIIIQQLTMENANLKSKMLYLETKIKELIQQKIEEKRNESK